MDYKLKSSIKELNNIELKDSVELTIGRATSNTISIDDNHISGKHLEIVVKNKKVYVKDLGSTNGTYIFGKKLEIDKLYELKPKHKIILGSENVTFEIEAVSHDNTQVIRTKNIYTIGRNPSNDIVVNAITVSSTHIKIEEKDGQWYFYDIGSTNGTYLDSLTNRVKSGKLEPNQILYLGNYKIPTNEIIKFILPTKAKKSKKINLTKDIITLGRNPKSDIYIFHPSVSFDHAKLIKNNNGYELEDLKSTNGTYVNGKQVKRKVQVKRNDEIQLGIYSFILNFDSQNSPTIMKKEFLDGWSIEAKNISIEIKDGIKLLDDISFTVNPGELVGLMGLSGAGKTTLLKALNGYDRPTQGTSYINGIDLYENFYMLKASIGYVPQDDIVHSELTVKEALQYYAKLRLPSDMGNKEIDELIKETLNKLGLNGTEDTLIGSPDTEKGISGGQRKRVNLAMELLAKPKVIFLDEPTSGLSAVDTKMVMEQLRALANEGITIIITIHQPSLDNYKFMDNQIILSFGKLAYYGSTYPNSIEFFNQDVPDRKKLLSNPDNALIGLYTKEKDELNLDPRKERNKKGIYWKNQYIQSKEYKEFVKDREGEKKQISNLTKSKIPFFRQLWIFIKRYVRIKLKDMSNTSILLLQAPLIAIMIAMLFSKSAYMGLDNGEMPMSPTLLFVIAISSIWFGTINASREIIAEKPIYERERMIGINIFPYVMSKFLVLSVLCFIQSIALVGIVEIVAPFSLGFGNDLKIIMLLTFLTSLGGLSIGLLVSAIAKSQSQALALVPLVLLPMIIFGGGMMTVKQMHNNHNKIAYYISQATPTRWALEEMVQIYDKRDDAKTVCSQQYPKMKNLKSPNLYTSCVKKRDFIKNNYGNSTTSSQIIYMILSLFIIIPLILVMLILKKRDNA